MKKILFLTALLMVLASGLAKAQTGVITLYDSIMTLPGCKLVGSNNCAQLDGTEKSVVKKTITLQRFVPGSGYIGVYFFDKKGTAGTQGGYSSGQTSFEPTSGGRIELGTALQVFERGNVTIEFDQPYTSSERLETQYEFVIYYLPHTEAQRQQFLLMLQDEDTNRFPEYKSQNQQNVDALCKALRTEARLPAACPQTNTSPVDDGGTGLTTNPNTLPELDFSGNPTRRPVVTIEQQERLLFVGEPVKIKTNVYDPDGKCQFFQFGWQKSDQMVVRDTSVDPYLGDLFFVPENTGAFTLTVRAKEACKELGTLTSLPISVRVIVNDKATAFPDIADAPKYANAIYDLYHLGVLRGYPDGTMRPNELVNRAEFLKMIFETLLYRIDKEVYSPRYPDVLPNDWFADYVHQADVLGVIKGYPDGRFRPEQNVNLAEALKMVMHFTTLDILDSQVYQFPDVQSTDWFSRYVQTAFREGILDDIKPGSHVRPGQYITRGKAAQIIVRTLLFPVNRINQADTDVLRRPEQFEDFSSFTF